MKRFPALLTLIVGSLLVMPTVGLAINFADVTDELPQAIAIETLAADEVIGGYPDGTFKPEQTIVRAEALKVILVAFGLTDEQQAEISFTDVEAEQWFYSHVANGVGRSIVQGYPDGSFKPGNVVNLSESLKMALMAADKQVITAAAYNHPDLNDEAWYKKYFDYAFEQNLLQLDAKGRVNPAQEMSRADFVELVYKIRELGAGKKFDITYNWQDAKATNGLVAKFPADWQNSPSPGGLVFYHRDPAFTNAFIAHTTPNGAHIIVELLRSGDKTPDQVLTGLDKEYLDLYGVGKVASERKQEQGRESLVVHVEEEGILDYYLVLSDGLVIAAQAEYGQGLKRADFISTIYHFHRHLDLDAGGTIEPDGELEVEEPETTQSLTERVGEARSKILLDGAGPEILELFSDEVIIETDVLGVGTGPVDYYFSQEANITIKYERGSKTILDIQEGATSKF